MRVTLDIDDDVLQAAKERARRQDKTTGQIISELMRLALNSLPAQSGASSTTATYGFRPFAKRGGIVNNALVDKLREYDVY